MKPVRSGRSVAFVRLPATVAVFVASTLSCGHGSSLPDAPVSAATQLAFRTPPVNTATGAIIAPAIVVAAEDARGNTVTTFTASVTLSFGANPGAATMSGTVTVAAVAGVATFSDIAVTSAAAGYTLTATSTGLSAAYSAAFNITPADVGPPAFPFASLVAGAEHTCGLTSVGAAYCWGSDSAGQLGDGTTTDRSKPTAVVGGLTFTSLALGYRHTCGLTTGGAAYCWGDNIDGALGDGTTSDHHVPTPVAGGPVFTNLSAGADVTCGLTAGGAAYCWGDNSTGELGDGTTINRGTPTPVAGGFVFTSLTSAGLATCGLTAGGAAYCWGYNQGDQLGVGNSTTPIVTAQPVVGGLAFTSLSLGSFTCGLTTGGAAYCWGNNTYGQLGDGTRADNPTSPTRVASILVFASLRPGGNHNCGLTAGGAAYCWGYNDFGQAGNGSTGPRLGVLSPTAVMGGLVFASLAPGFFHTCGLTAAGGAYCWGYNFYGQLGDHTTTDRSVPVPVVRP